MKTHFFSRTYCTLPQYILLASLAFFSIVFITSAQCDDDNPNDLDPNDPSIDSNVVIFNGPDVHIIAPTVKITGGLTDPSLQWRVQLKLLKFGPPAILFIEKVEPSFFQDSAAADTYSALEGFGILKNIAIRFPPGAQTFTIASLRVDNVIQPPRNLLVTNISLDGFDIVTPIKILEPSKEDGLKGFIAGSTLNTMIQTPKSEKIGLGDPPLDTTRLHIAIDGQIQAEIVATDDFKVFLPSTVEVPIVVPPGEHVLTASARLPLFVIPSEILSVAYVSDLITIRGYPDFSGFRKSDLPCGETDNPPARWVIDLEQDGRSVSGLIAFHDCPGGGAVEYRVEGSANFDDFIKLNGEKSQGPNTRGPLGANEPNSRTFTVRMNGAPDPDLAPPR